MQILGQHGAEPAGQFGYMGDAPLLQVLTSKGFLLEGKTGHRVWASRQPAWDWVSLSDLSVGDAVQLRCGDNLWAPSSNVTPTDVAQLIASAPTFTELPRSIRSAHQEAVYAFVLGLLPAQGSCVKFAGDQAAIDMQAMLLNLGYVSTRHGSEVTLNDDPRQGHTQGELLSDTIVAINALAEQPTYDINVPGTSTVVTNGIVSHNSDVRLKHTSRALSAAPFSPKPDKDKDYNETEPSVEFAGKDVYRYVVIKAVKNKLWTPQRQAPLRIWVEDGSGTARGFDPVFDTIWYLFNTGQLAGTRKSFKLNLHGLGPGAKPVTWEHLKRWVLGDKAVMTKICTALGYKPMSIRAFCFKQMANGTAEDLYLAYTNSKQKNGDAEEDASADGD